MAPRRRGAAGAIADTRPLGEAPGVRALATALAGIAVASLLVLAWRDGGVRDRWAGVDRVLPAAVYLVLLAAVAAAAIGIRPRRPLGAAAIPAAFGASLLAFSSPLFAAWRNGEWPAMIGGAVPWSDAQLYLGGAERLLFFDDLDVFNSRRPLNAMFLAVRLSLTDLDVRVALVLQALLVGLACYVAARAVARELGAVAGLALFAGMFGFTRVYVPATMSESLGVVFGALAFAALWRALHDGSAPLAVGGAFLLAVSFDARAGVILLAVAVPLWFARHLRRSGILNWGVLAASAVAVTLGFALNYGAVVALGGDLDTVLGNGGYLVYGMAKGMPSWDVDRPALVRVYADNPQIVAMSEVDRTRFINDAARQAVLDDPMRFAVTALRSERNYLLLAKRDMLLPFPLRVHRPLLVLGAAAVLAAVVIRARGGRSQGMAVDMGMFACMVVAVPVLVSRVPSVRPPPGLGLGLAVTAFVAFLVIGTRRLGLARGLSSLTFVAFAAIVAFLPVLGVDTVRVFAASVPFFALPLALAVAVLAGGHEPSAVGGASSSSGRAPLLMGAALLIILFVGTPVAMAAVDQPTVAPMRCPDGRRAEPLLGGVGVRILDADTAGSRDIDEINPSTLQKQLRSYLPMPGIHLLGLSGPTSLIGGLTDSGVDRLAIVDGHVAALGGRPLYLCGDAKHDALTDLIFSYFPQPLDIFHGRPL